MPTTAAFVSSGDRHVEQLLATLDVHVTTWAADDLHRLNDGALRPPDLLIVDVRRDNTLPPSLAQVRRQFPGVGVIIVAAQLDPAVMLEAMRAGVSEWVTEPVTLADLKAAIERVAVQRAPVVMGQVFAFLGAKGGVGATTVAVNVAAVLAKASEGRTLLIDLHSAYGDAGVYLGADPRFSVMDALENTHRLDEAFFRSVVVKPREGPDLLASGDRTGTGTVDTHRVRALVDFAARQYQYVVLDCPRSNTEILDALESVKLIVIVVNQELATLRNGSRIASSLRQRFGRNRVVVVVSRFDAAADIGQDDIERVVGGEVACTLPSDYRQAVAALNKGRPLVLGNGSKLSEALAEFARTFSAADAPARTPSDRQSGFLSRLLGKR